MKHRMKSRFLILLLVLLCQTLSVVAQIPVQASAQTVPELLEPPSTLQRAWQRGELRERGSIGFFGTHAQGTFRQPQEAASQTQGSFVAQGVKRLSGWLLTGNFRYGRTGQDSVRLTTVANALNRNPYILTDTSGGAWLRDDIALETALCTPLVADGWTFGARLNYGVGQGARRNDPRPLFRYRALGIAPALTWKIAPQHSIGAALELHDSREEAELGFFANDNTFVWRMRGLASYDRIPLVSAQRVMLSRSIGGGLQYEFENFDDTDGRITAAVRGYSRVDSVRDGVAEPQFAGAYTEQGAQMLASVSSRGALFGADGRQELHFAASALMGRGIDPIFRAANITDNRLSASLTGRFRTAAAPYSPPLDAALSPSVALGFDLAERRDVAADIRSRVAALSADAALEGASALDSSHVLDWRVGVGFRAPLSAEFLRNPSLPVLALERALAVPDFEIRSARVFTAGGQIAFAWKAEATKADVAQELWLRVGIGGGITASNHVLYTFRASVRGFFEILL
jgi:hypothetical protein